MSVDVSFKNELRAPTACVAVSLSPTLPANHRQAKALYINIC